MQISMIPNQTAKSAALVACLKISVYVPLKIAFFMVSVPVAVGLL
jgi:hypothetical protein